MKAIEGLSRRRFSIRLAAVQRLENGAVFRDHIARANGNHSSLTKLGS